MQNVCPNSKNICQHPTTRICSSSSPPLCHKKSGSIFLFLYISNMVNWISPKLLTVFLVGSYLASIFPKNFRIFIFCGNFIRVGHTTVQRGPRTKSRGPKGLQLKVRARRAPRLLQNICDDSSSFCLQ